MSSPRPHFLLLTYPLQGHIAPALRLAKRLLAAAPDALVTFSTTDVAHRLMFPATTNPSSASASASAAVSGNQYDGRLEFLPFSDGTETGYVHIPDDPASFNAYMATFHAAGARSAGDLIDELTTRRRHVTRVVYTLMLPWAADVAHERGIASALYWIQPVAVLAIYHHYFHGGHGAVAAAVARHRHDPDFVVDLPPGLPPQTISDLPSFLTDSTDPSDFFHSIFTTIRDVILTLDREEIPVRSTVLVNTCQELEVGALAAVGAHHEVLPIGPVMLPSGDGDAGIFKQDDDANYMGWLDAKPASSVVYVSFGSLATMEREHLDELLRGLEDSGRPYLCVVRKDNKAALLAADDAETQLDKELQNGIVVEWCDQVRVLSHAAVGCFVTHCGWNSVLESLVAGVPMVCVPRMSDQRTNAQLVVREWRVGVRAQVDDGAGVMRAAEVRRCVDEVMGNSEAAAEVRRMAEEWKQVVTKAMGKGGSSDRNLMAFVDGARSAV